LLGTAQQQQQPNMNNNMLNNNNMNNNMLNNANNLLGTAQQQSNMNNNMLNNVNNLLGTAQQQQHSNVLGAIESLMIIDTKNGTIYEVGKDSFVSVANKTTGGPVSPNGGTKVAVKVNGLQKADNQEVKVNNQQPVTQTSNGGAGQQGGNFHQG
jgi:hypothetical protein